MKKVKVQNKIELKEAIQYLTNKSRENRQKVIDLSMLDISRLSNLDGIFGDIIFEDETLDMSTWDLSNVKGRYLSGFPFGIHKIVDLKSYISKQQSGDERCVRLQVTVASQFNGAVYSQEVFTLYTVKYPKFFKELKTELLVLWEQGSEEALSYNSEEEETQYQDYMYMTMEVQEDGFGHMNKFKLDAPEVFTRSISFAESVYEESIIDRLEREVE